MTDLRIALTPGGFSGRATVLSRATGDGHVRLGHVVSVDDADVALFPYDLASCLRTEADRLALIALVAKNAREGLRTLLFVTHDHSAAIDVGQPDSILLRTSMLRSLQYGGDLPTPVCVEDPYADSAFEPRPWSPRPVVGFMGYSGMGRIHRAMRSAEAGEPQEVPGAAERAHAPLDDVVLRSPVNIGLHIRRRAIEALGSSGVVSADIVERDRYFGYFTAAERAPMRLDYLRHLFASDYVLCVRGAGNYSIRLFETMAAGRIPVIVDTDLVLPCADVIDWQALAVWVPLADLDRIDDVIAREHAELGQRGFETRQAEVRQAWIDHLSSEGFSAYVASRVGTSRGRG